MILFSATVPVFAERSNEKKFKGVEMYSWKDNSGDWRFTIINGTNWKKTEDWIKKSTQDTVSMNGLQNKFLKLAKGQQVYWFHKDSDGFLYPPESYIDKIEALAKNSEVKLHRNEEGK